MILQGVGVCGAIVLLWSVLMSGCSVNIENEKKRNVGKTTYSGKITLGLAKKKDAMDIALARLEKELGRPATFADLNAESREVIHDEAAVWDVFRHLAFGAESAPEEYRENINRIKKWSDPVIVAVAGYQQHKERVAKHVARLNAAIPLEVRMHDLPRDGDRGNFGVLFTPDFRQAIYETHLKDLEYLYQKLIGDKDYIKKRYAAVQKLSPPPLYFGNFIMGEKLNIAFAMVFLKTNDPVDSIQAGIEEEITQLLGLANDYHGYPYTMFNDRDITNRLTALDWFLLKLLYHEEIKIGMTEKDVRKVFNTVYKETLKKAGL